MGIVDFVRRKARYCDYFFSEHCIISVKYAFLLVTNLLTLMSVVRFCRGIASSVNVKENIGFLFIWFEGIDNLIQSYSFFISSVPFHLGFD